MKATLGFTDLLYDKTDGVATVTIDRAETYNSVTQHTMEEMIAAFRDAAEDDAIGAIVLTGAGEKAFCSGGNIQAISERTSSVKRGHLRVMAQLALVMRTSGKPIIAAVNGYAIGLGNELHVMCDITIAAEHAKFGQTGPKIGSVPVWAATTLLSRSVGEKKAREMLYFCRQYTAAQALDMGLINAVVPLADLASTTRAWCDELLDKSPQTLRIAKLAFNQESDQSFWGGVFAGSELLAMHIDSDEFIEGPTAWLEKRKPNFRRYRKKPERRATES
jgi:naphthoate synthase/2-ketocyclohexanecarboxyl-CoA hydrolase